MSHDSRADREKYKSELEILERVTGRGIMAIVASMDSLHPGEVQYFYSEPKLQGTSLDTVLHGSNRRLSGNEIEMVLCDVACGLRGLHNRGVTHRHLSSQNILIHKVNDTLRAVICVFDQAFSLCGRTDDDRASARDTVSGVVDICAPETLVEGAAITTSVDVFSFGVLLVEVCVGERPAPRPMISVHDGRTLTEVERREHQIGLMDDGFFTTVATTCLDDIADRRPTAGMLATVFELLTGEADPATVQSDGCQMIEYAAWRATERAKTMVLYPAVVERFSEILRAATGHEWASVVKHRFVQELCAGTIPDAVMLRYLIQDLRFLDSMKSMIRHTLIAADSHSAAGPFAHFLHTMFDETNRYFERALAALHATDHAHAQSDSAAMRGFAALMQEAAAGGAYPAMVCLLSASLWSYLEWASSGPQLRPANFVHREWIAQNDNPTMHGFVRFLLAEADRVGPTMPEQCHAAFAHAVCCERAIFDDAYLVA